MQGYKSADRIYSIEKVTEDATTGARRVSGYRMATITKQTPKGDKILDGGGKVWEKTIWPKGLSQQDVNLLSNQAFDAARKVPNLPQGGKVGMTGSRTFVSGVSFNGKTMAVEGSLDPVSGKVISCYPSYNTGSFSTIVNGADW